MDKYNKNLGYYYLKQRFESFYFDPQKLDRMDREFFSVEIEKQEKNELEYNERLKKLYLSVGYPGLLIGTGTTLEFTPIKDKERVKNDNYKLGINFDYTTGLPIIPGSSIKGTLRSFFPDSEVDTEEIMEYKTAIINSILERDFSIDEIEILCKNIFEGYSGVDETLPIYKRDKFIEGRFIAKKGKNIVEKDYLAPHKEILKDPVPLEMLKVAPRTGIEIVFELHDTEIVGIEVKAEEKLNLFREILYLTGLGAKTNTGYGHFDRELGKDLERSMKVKEENIKKEKEEETRRKTEEEKQKRRAQLSPIEKWKEEFEEKSDEEKKNFKEDLEKFDGEEKKIVAQAYLDFFSQDKKPSKKTKLKIDELKSIINS